MNNYSEAKHAVNELYDAVKNMNAHLLDLAPHVGTGFIIAELASIIACLPEKEYKIAINKLNNQTNYCKSKETK